MPTPTGAMILIGQALTLAEKASLKRSAAEAYYNQVRQTPMTWDFGEIEAKDDAGVSAGAAGVQTLQMRNDPYNGQDDRTNWISVGVGAIAALVGSAPSTLQPLKTTANVWVQTTAAQALTVLVTGDGVQLSALQRGYAMLQTFGAIKKAIADALAAEDEVALDAIDVTAGYPA